MLSNENRQIEDLLGTVLPSQIQDLHYFKFQPSDDLAFYVVYIKFSTSIVEFNNFMRRMNMDFYRMGGDADLHLPAAWATEPQVHLDWWDPSSSTPKDAAAKSFGANGWIVAKYEDNYIYLIVTDTGYAGGN